MTWSESANLSTAADESAKITAVGFDMPKLHISQDETGFWQVTFEDDDGNLTLISHQFEPDKGAVPFDRGIFVHVDEVQR